LQQLLADLQRRPQKFNVILVDDTSRLSRDDIESKRLAVNMKFLGFRLIFVSQGIDSEDPPFDVLMTIHGLVDSLYIKELAKKTHRGLEGRALGGFHTGGRCFGYKNDSAREGVSS